MEKIKTTLKKLWADESAQGATEYIFLLMVLVGIMFVFKDNIRSIVTGKIEELGADMGSFNGRE